MSPPGDTSLSDVFIVLDGSNDLVSWNHPDNRPHSNYCVSRDPLKLVRAAMVDTLLSITFESMARWQAPKSDWSQSQ